ncbi:hypothetical protein OGATHE_003977 [Ogataea polymorpha]|uniref:Uncharacterized protein n=1 Tax=Ogataea polymorpha TaxID=460523 RepID=A0A9P8P4P5_9ASCO|nr:hypothetical protein OGATHE_003977 [Ogataea polymorpha]
MRSDRTLLASLAASLWASQVSAYGNFLKVEPRYWNSSIETATPSSTSSCSTDSTITQTRVITLSSGAASDQYWDATLTPTVTDTNSIGVTENDYITITTTYTDCNYRGQCSTVTATELVSSYTTTISGHVTVVTGYETLTGSSTPAPVTSTTADNPRTVLTRTSCSAGHCSTWTTEEIVSSYTTTISGHETVVTELYPLSGSSSAPLITPVATPVAIVSCSAGKCSTWTTEEILSSYTTTISGHETVVTTLIPLSGTSDLDSAGPQTATATKTSCSAGKCSTWTTEEIVSSYTTTISGHVTVITTTCPLSAAATPTTAATVTETVTSCSAGKCSTWTTKDTVSSSPTTISGHVTVATTHGPVSSEAVVSSKGGAAAFQLTSYTTTIDNTATVVTTICPLSSSSSSAKASKTKTSSTATSTASTSASASVTTVTTVVGGVTTVLTTYCPESSASASSKVSDQSSSTLVSSSSSTATSSTVTSSAPESTVDLAEPSTVSVPVETEPAVSTVVYTSTISSVPVELTTYSTVTKSTLLTSSTASTASSSSAPAASIFEGAAGKINIGVGLISMVYGLICVL